MTEKHSIHAAVYIIKKKGLYTIMGFFYAYFFTIIEISVYAIDSQVAYLHVTCKSRVF